MRASYELPFGSLGNLNGEFHNARNLLCFFPDIPNCVCKEDINSPEMLLSGKTEEFELVKTIDIPIYKQDESINMFTIERYFKVEDLCRFLCLRNKVSEKFEWCIAEFWPRYGFVNVLQKNDLIMMAYKRLMRLTDNTGKIYFILNPVIKEEVVNDMPYNLNAEEPSSDSDEEEYMNQIDTNAAVPSWVKYLGKTNKVEEVEEEQPPKTENTISFGNLRTFSNWIQKKTYNCVSIISLRGLRRYRAPTEFTANQERMLGSLHASEPNNQMEMQPTPIVVKKVGYSNEPLALQPWYHPNITKSEATRILTDAEMESGLFLVRASLLFPGLDILSYKVHNTVVHVNIVTDYVITIDKYVYTIDHGRNLFYSIPEIINYHQLNTGYLFIKLGSYIERMSTVINIE